jgi:hypothetical protein
MTAPQTPLARRIAAVEAARKPEPRFVPVWRRRPIEAKDMSGAQR